MEQRHHAMDTDVLIVGAGPVGLFLANECARRDLRWRLIETRASQSVHSKALAIFPRTMEIFDMAGVVAPFLANANRVTSVAVMAHGRTERQTNSGNGGAAVSRALTEASRPLRAAK